MNENIKNNHFIQSQSTGNQSISQQINKMYKNKHLYTLCIITIKSFVIHYLHGRQVSLKVLGGKVNEEGPDLLGRDGHIERTITATRTHGAV